MIRKILKIVGISIPFLTLSQALAHPDLIPHVHPHAHSDYTSVLILIGIFGSIAAGLAMVRITKEKKVKK